MSNYLSAVQATTFSGSVYETSYSENFGYYPKALEEAVKIVEHLPSIQIILDKLIKSGGIHIKTEEEDVMGSHKYMWHCTERATRLRHFDSTKT